MDFARPIVKYGSTDTVFTSYNNIAYLNVLTVIEVGYIYCMKKKRDKPNITYIIFARSL